MHPVSCTTTHHDITDLVNHGIVKNRKAWISWEWNITFLQNKKILNLSLTWHILWSYRFVAEVTFNDIILTHFHLWCKLIWKIGNFCFLLSFLRELKDFFLIKSVLWREIWNWGLMDNKRIILVLNPRCF